MRGVKRSDVRKRTEDQTRQERRVDAIEQREEAVARPIERLEAEKRHCLGA